MFKLVLCAAASFSVASLAAVPAAAYTLPDRGLSAPSAAPAKLVFGNQPALLGAPPASLIIGNLVTNGSFETGDFSGWDQVGDTTFSFVTDEFAGGGPTDGTFHGAFGPVDPSGGGILQSIATTAGGVYTLTFDLANLDVGPNAFGLFWDGAFVSIDFDVDPFNYQSLTASLTATGTQTDLAFVFYHEPSFWLLDNVGLVNTIPEPQSWAMLIAGFGLVGAAARRRRLVIAA